MSLIRELFVDSSMVLIKLKPNIWSIWCNLSLKSTELPIRYFYPKKVISGLLHVRTILYTNYTVVYIISSHFVQVYTTRNMQYVKSAQIEKLCVFLIEIWTQSTEFLIWFLFLFWLNFQIRLLVHLCSNWVSWTWPKWPSCIMWTWTTRG